VKPLEGNWRELFEYISSAFSSKDVGKTSKENPQQRIDGRWTDNIVRACRLQNGTSIFVCVFDECYIGVTVIGSELLYYRVYIVA
jgi:hypothetical protein